jgi:hypothetical protein
MWKLKIKFEWNTKGKVITARSVQKYAFTITSQFKHTIWKRPGLQRYLEITTQVTQWN